MAEKKVFFPDLNKSFREEIITYKYYSGFAVSQKQKSVRSLHESILLKHPSCKVLEISTKSENPTGVSLSAFNLKFFHKELQEYRNIENVFQSSKVFENGGPYRDLLNVSPKDAKKDERLKTSGQLITFNLYNTNWPLIPRSMFYDWLYISALMEHKELADKLLEFDCFTDIEFNHNKSINCQARTAAIYVSLARQGILEEKTASPEAFKTIYVPAKQKQMDLFSLIK